LIRVENVTREEISVIDLNSYRINLPESIRFQWWDRRSCTTGWWPGGRCRPHTRTPRRPSPPSPRSGASSRTLGRPGVRDKTF